MSSSALKLEVATGRPGRKSSIHQILTAAVECFLQDGFEGTFMSDIAMRAGVSRQALYGHFKSKEELFGSLITLYSEETWRRVIRRLDFSCDPPQVLGRCFFMTARMTKTPWGRVLFDLRNRSIGTLAARAIGLPINDRFWRPILLELAKHHPMRIEMERAYPILTFLLVGFLTSEVVLDSSNDLGEAAARFIFAEPDRAVPCEQAQSGAYRREDHRL